ncbi:MAG: DUF4097 family beta strand repeat-containing protein [Candidatus Palauibacterales bacterium]|nr:DUF4097 family beta strand repeat-containing protein [Candidatus Palauibacterales bacterium]MDP2528858.1 DUF4097 family beta strand repeat-containing protein [Candidatus Palauibacterales bacterium]
MDRLDRSWWAPLILMVWAWALAPHPTAAQSPDSLARSVAPDGVVSISAREADVTVVGSSGRTLVVRARPETLRRIRLEGSGSRLSVRDDGADDEIEVSLPSAVQVEVHTRDGDVTVRGLTGRVTIESMDGDVHIQGDPQSLRVAGVSGNITVSGSPARLKLNTVSGDVTVPSATGSVDISTANGDIEVGGRGISDGTFTSASGDITFRAQPTSSATLSFQTATGEVTLALPDGVGASFEITTVSGELVTDRQAQLLGSQHFGGGRHYRLSVGNGSVHVSVQAVTGDVHIEGS